MPVAIGRDESCHISEVDYIVENTGFPLIEVKPAVATETDKTIASHIIKEIHDGCCIQLGIGGLPNTIGQMIAESGIKHLGVHTEMLADSMWTCSKPAASMVPVRLPTPAKWPIPLLWALNGFMILSILTRYAVSARHHISTTRRLLPKPEPDFDQQLSGSRLVLPGIFRIGQWTANQWYWWSSGLCQGCLYVRGRKSIIAMSSTAKRKDGSVVSRIVPTLGPGTIVTLPRWSVHKVCTEYGMVDLKGASTWQRAERLISIAHPDFRDELIKEADRMRIWLPSNKIA